jgi:hypothetical protein
MRNYGNIHHNTKLSKIDLKIFEEFNFITLLQDNSKFFNDSFTLIRANKITFEMEKIKKMNMNFKKEILLDIFI